MKITVENQDRKPCKHEVGKVYWNGYEYHLIIHMLGTDRFSCLDLENCYVLDDHYKTMADLDADNPDDVLVDAELIIRK